MCLYGSLTLEICKERPSLMDPEWPDMSLPGAPRAQDPGCMRAVLRVYLNSNPERWGAASPTLSPGLLLLTRSGSPQAPCSCPLSSRTLCISVVLTKVWWADPVFTKPRLLCQVNGFRNGIISQLFSWMTVTYMIPSLSLLAFGSFQLLTFSSMVLLCGLSPQIIPLT